MAHSSPETGLASESRRLLAVFAHPDDETFLAGGTLAKYAADGVAVQVLCATRGEAGRRGRFGRLSPRAFGLRRESELRNACAALGLLPPRILGCADGGVAGDCESAVAAAVSAELDAFPTSIVLTFGPEGMSGHPDHVAIHRAVVAALDRRREMHGASRLPRLYYVRGSLSLPPECRCTAQAPLPVTAEVDISDVGARKLAAIRCHGSQQHLQPRTEEELALVRRSPEWIQQADVTARSSQASSDPMLSAPTQRVERRRHPPAARTSLQPRRK